jgi:hypothetical protein
MQGTLSDVLGLPTMENDSNEDEGEVGGKFDGFDWPLSDEETGCINFSSINTPVPATLLTTPALTPHSDVPTPTHLATPFSPSYPAMLVPSAIHTERIYALAASGSHFSSISTSQSSTPGPSAKRCHISKILPDHDPEDIMMGEHIFNFTEVSPVCKCCAICSAEEFEVNLSDTDLAILVNLFHPADI